MRPPEDDSQTQTKLHQDEAGTAPSVVSDGRPRRMSPPLKKAEEYRRNRNYVSEYPHLERRSWPKKKALRHQTHRRKVDAALLPALGKVSEVIDDFAPAFPRKPRSPSRHMHGSQRLGESVASKLEKRFAFTGSNIGTKYLDAHYRKRLVPFLEAIVQGRHGHSIEIAKHFARVLETVPFGLRPARGHWSSREDLPPYFSPVGSATWDFALRTLFTEQPAWEQRLREWVEEVRGPDDAAAEPAWKRIRLERRTAGR